MKFFLPLLLLSFLSIAKADAQQSDPWPDSVVVFHKGAMSNFGQADQYFPANILSGIDPNATRLQQSSDPAHICALGYGGIIVLAFTDNVVVNGEGPDITVFENVFVQEAGPMAGIPFVEPASVEVSNDGETWFLFPYDEATLEGMAGVTWTNGGEDPLDPEVSGGDQFDLAGLGLDSIRFIRIWDKTSIVRDNPGHMYYNQNTAFFNGFDLDAVAALHSADVVTSVREEERASPEASLSVYPNPAGTGSQLTVRWNAPGQYALKLYNILGEEVAAVASGSAGGLRQVVIPLASLPAGLYLASLTGRETRVVRKVMIVK